MTTTMKIGPIGSTKGLTKPYAWNSLTFWSSVTWANIQQNLQAEHVKIKPEPKYLFRPMIETPLHKVKVMLIGSEPSANMDVDGLAYSYPRACTDTHILPHALGSIFTEYSRDLELPQPRSGSLVPWARKGVLLWNDTPTVKVGYPFSHSGWGWHKLTQEIIDTLYLNNKNTVFVFWGPGQMRYVDTLPRDALVLECGSPSLTMASKGFHGSSPFSKINAMLQSKGVSPIDWRLP